MEKITKSFVRIIEAIVSALIVVLISLIFDLGAVSNNDGNSIECEQIGEICADTDERK